MKTPRFLVLGLALFAAPGCTGVFDGVFTNGSGSWAEQQESRQAEHAAYLEANDVAYTWFTDAPFSQEQGIPFIVMRLLPDVAPEIWGADALKTAGLFDDARQPASPVPRGWGWSGMIRPEAEIDSKVDVMSTACGSCHLGRVRTGNNEFAYIDGGISAQFNLVDFRVKLNQTVESLARGAVGDAARLNQVTNAFMAALDRRVAENPNYFYKNFEWGGRTFDALYEANQVALFRGNAQAVVGSFMVRTSQKIRAFQTLVTANYPEFINEMLAGFPGMADAAGINRSFTHIQRVDAGAPGVPMPRNQSLVDIMAVWQQDKRAGGQWNGNIPHPMYRNLAAQLTLGFGATTDIRISALASDLLGGLPAPVYPFDVDIDLAARGKELYQANCEGCHQAGNNAVYDLGTDMLRARNTTDASVAGAQASFVAFCGPERTVVMPDGTQRKPCAAADGGAIAPENVFRPNTETEGYQATALDGVWAQAPYLHGGSVPTLYHLLVPSQRPATFYKSRLDYDQTNVGFAWDSLGVDESGRPEGYLYRANAIGPLSNAGHDRDVPVGDSVWKLDWSDDLEGAAAIVEYMKTL